MAGGKSDRGTFVTEFYSLSPPQRLFVNFGTPCTYMYILFYIDFPLRLACTFFSTGHKVEVVVSKHFFPTKRDENTDPGPAHAGIRCMHVRDESPARAPRMRDTVI